MYICTYIYTYIDLLRRANLVKQLDVIRRDRMRARKDEDLRIRDENRRKAADENGRNAAAAIED
jgi:hypothetical protein